MNIKTFESYKNESFIEYENEDLEKWMRQNSEDWSSRRKVVGICYEREKIQRLISSNQFALDLSGIADRKNFLGASVWKFDLMKDVYMEVQLYTDEYYHVLCSKKIRYKNRDYYYTRHYIADSEKGLIDCLQYLCKIVADPDDVPYYLKD